MKNLKPLSKKSTVIATFILTLGALFLSQADAGRDVARHRGDTRPFPQVEEHAEQGHRRRRGDCRQHVLVRLDVDQHLDKYRREVS